MSELTHAIRRIANPERRPAGGLGTVARTLSTAAVTGLAAMVLMPAPGHALSLGELTVRSALGQPLRASIPFRTSPGELVTADCVRSGPAASALAGNSGLPPVSQVQLRLAGDERRGTRELVLTTVRPLYEPLYELAIQVSCPGTPGMVRQYVLMLDLPGMVESANPAVALPVAAGPVPRSRAEATMPATPAARRPATRPVTPITDGTRYRVQPGDTLSAIAARVQGRTIGIWAMAEQIFAANPDAFTGGNPDRLRAGVELLIPGVVADRAPVASVPATDPTPAPAPLPAVDPPIAAGLPPVPAPVEEAGLEVAAEVLPPAPETLVAPAQSTQVPEAMEATTDRAAGPGTAKPVSGAEMGTGDSSPLAAVAAGAGFGILISLLLWSRRLRNRFRPAPATPRPGPARNAAPVVAASAAPVVARVSPPPEPAISVSYDALDEPLAATFGQASGRNTSATGRNPAPPLEDITADLEQLFIDDDGRDESDLALTTDSVESTAEQPRGPLSRDEVTGDYEAMTLESPTAMAPPMDLDPLALGVDLDDELTRLGDHPAAHVDTMDEAPIDVGFSDGTDLDLDQPTVQRPMATRREDAGPGASAPDADRTRAQSLLEAMDLLERDYEEELTASQLLDPEMVQAALEGGPDGDASGIRRRRR